MCTITTTQNNNVVRETYPDQKQLGFYFNLTQNVLRKVNKLA